MVSLIMEIIKSKEKKMGKIDFSLSKTLKLSNVITKELEEQDFESLDKIIIQMDNYIRAKGAIPIGPIIQHNKKKIIDDKHEIVTTALRQTNNYINNVDRPYYGNSIIRIKDCMYAHFVGPESKLGLAFDKLTVIAFEENIKLSDSNYVIFVDQNDDDDIVADIFMEKKND